MAQQPIPPTAPNPFKALLQSRKFWLAAVGAGQTILAHYVQIPVDVTLSINGLLAIVIATIAYEDANKA